MVITHGVLCSNIWHQLAWWIDQLLALALNEIRGELGNAKNRVSTCGLVVGGGLVVHTAAETRKAPRKRAAAREQRKECSERIVADISCLHVHYADGQNRWNDL